MNLMPKSHASLLKVVSYVTSAAALLQALIGSFSTIIPQPWGVVATTVAGGLVVVGHDLSTLISGQATGTTAAAPPGAAAAASPPP